MAPVVACSPYPAADPGVYGGRQRHFPTSSQGFLDAVHASGVEDLQCSHVTAHVEAPYVFSATGCGRRVQYSARRASPGTLVDDPSGYYGFTRVEDASDDSQVVWTIEREIQSTDGAFFRDDDASRLDATRASGARDLRCTASIDARALHAYRASDTYLAEGCGQRASYKLDSHAMLLLSVVNVNPPAVAPTASATP